MKLTRPLCFLDIEATGVDTQKDFIIECGLLVWDGETVTHDGVRRFKPPIQIPAEATEVHHITDADVANESPFDAYVGNKILKLLTGCDIAGYNLRRLDLPLLDEELRRVGLKLDLTGVRLLDVQGIYFKKNPRSLADCIRFYCGREPVASHGAQVDNQETLAAFQGQLAKHEDLAAMSFEELVAFSTMNPEREMVDVAGKLYRDKDGDLRYTLAKVRDVKVRDDVGFAYWMLRQDRPGFPGSTCEALEAELERIANEPPAGCEELPLTGQGGVEDVAEAGAPI